MSMHAEVLHSFSDLNMSEEQLVKSWNVNKVINGELSQRNRTRQNGKIKS